MLKTRPRAPFPSSMGYLVLAVGQGMRLAWKGTAEAGGLVSTDRGARLGHSEALDVVLRQGRRLARKGFVLSVAPASSFSSAPACRSNQA